MKPRTLWICLLDGCSHWVSCLEPSGSGAEDKPIYKVILIMLAHKTKLIPLTVVISQKVAEIRLESPALVKGYVVTTILGTVHQAVTGDFCPWPCDYIQNCSVTLDLSLLRKQVFFHGFVSSFDCVTVYKKHFTVTVWQVKNHLLIELWLQSQLCWMYNAYGSDYLLKM